MNNAWIRVWLSLFVGLAGEGRSWSAAPEISSQVRNLILQRTDVGYNVGIVVGMINADGRTYFSAGKTAIGGTDAPNARTLFEIGSVTKVFTTTLLAEAVRRGELTLGDTVQSHLPAAVTVPRGQQREIRLEDLATQTSGLPTNPTNLCEELYQPFGCYSTPRLFEFLNGYSLSREPGAQWEYSNLGMGLLGQALAYQAGTNYEALLKQRVLEPLGLRNTAIHFPASEAGRLAQGHSGVLVRPPFEIPGLEGAGSLRSCAEDLLTFLAYQLELVDTPLAPALRSTRERRAATSYPAVDIGLGWWLWNLAGGQVVQHGGDTPGQTAVIAFHPARKTGVVILSNSRANAASALTDLALNLLDPSYPLAAFKRPAPVGPETLATFAGNYGSGDGERFVVTLQHGRLVFQHSSSGFAFTTYPEGTRRFAALEIELGAPPVFAEFIYNGFIKVVALEWTQAGETIDYSRLPDPAALRIARVDGELDLTLEGDEGNRYLIEASEDWTTWQSIGGLWSGLGSIRVPYRETGAGRARVFRAQVQ